MNRRQTILGVAAPAHRDAPRASSRYRLHTAELAHGAIICAVTEAGVPLRAEVIELENGGRVFVDVDGMPTQISRWRAASKAEMDAFIHERRARRWADYASLHGAPALYSKLKCLPMPEREAALVAASAALRARGMRAKAEQVDVFRITGEG